ncbi:MAG: hypothetical protein D6751_03400 [Deltaproteobacteria bacterium]|nr:MAG: hypothetical protein D6751_03400 [Deltaproteobacteria bacterium]
MNIKGHPAIKLAALGWTLAIVALASDGASGGPDLFAGQDKVLHAGAFGLLAVLYGLGWPDAEDRPRRWLTASGCFLFGVLIEIGQLLLTRTRSAELLDLAADLVGIVAAVVLLPYLFPTRPRETAA